MIKNNEGVDIMKRLMVMILITGICISSISVSGNKPFGINLGSKLPVWTHRQ